MDRGAIHFVILQWSYPGIPWIPSAFVTFTLNPVRSGRNWSNTTSWSSTRNGKPFAVLTEVSPTVVDRDLQARRDLRFGRALDAIRSRTREQGSDKMTLDEINAVIREVREERRHEAGA